MSHKADPVRTATVALLVVLKDTAPDANTRRIREQSLRCHRLATQLYRKGGRS